MSIGWGGEFLETFLGPSMNFSLVDKSQQWKVKVNIEAVRSSFHDSLFELLFLIDIYYYIVVYVHLVCSIRSIVVVVYLLLHCTCQVHTNTKSTINQRPFIIQFQCSVINVFFYTYSGNWIKRPFSWGLNQLFPWTGSIVPLYPASIVFICSNYTRILIMRKSDIRATLTMKLTRRSNQNVTMNNPRYKGSFC